MNSYFVTATGTEVGKTFITTSICYHLKNKGKIVKAVKPVISGFDEDNIDITDTAKLLKSQGIKVTDRNIQEISPWRFNAPVAANIAARLENMRLNYFEILQYCKQTMNNEYDYLFFEGAGGVMSPVTDDKTFLDLICDLNIEVILVCGAYLGAISHILTAVKALDKVKIQAIIINQSQQDNGNIEEITEFISQYLHTTVHISKYIVTTNDDKKELYASSAITDIFL